MKLGEKDRQVWQHPTLLFADRSTPNQIELGWNLLIHGSGRNTNQVLIEARSAASLPPLSHTTGVLSGLLFRVVRLDNDVYEFNVRQITIEIIELNCSLSYSVEQDLVCQTQCPQLHGPSERVRAYAALCLLYSDKFLL